MPNDNKVSQLIEVLLKETFLGKLKWHRSDSRQLTRGNDDVIKYFCETNYKGQQVAVFERRTRTYDGDRDSFYWVSTPTFAFMLGEEVVWDYTGSWSEIETLHNVAKESAAGVDAVIDKLLA